MLLIPPPPVAAVHDHDHARTRRGHGAGRGRWRLHAPLRPGHLRTRSDRVHPLRQRHFDRDHEHPAPVPRRPHRLRLDRPGAGVAGSRRGGCEPVPATGRPDPPRVPVARLVLELREPVRLHGRRPGARWRRRGDHRRGVDRHLPDHDPGRRRRRGPGRLVDDLGVPARRKHRSSHAIAPGLCRRRLVLRHDEDRLDRRGFGDPAVRQGRGRQ